MRTFATTIITVCALLCATLPSRASGVLEQEKADAAPRCEMKFVTKGRALTPTEATQYALKTEVELAIINPSAAGQNNDSNTGTIILATIGALVLIGVVIGVLAKKNNEEE